MQSEAKKDFTKLLSILNDPNFSWWEKKPKKGDKMPRITKAILEAANTRAINKIVKLEVELQHQKKLSDVIMMRPEASLMIAVERICQSMAEVTKIMSDMVLRGIRR